MIEVIKTHTGSATKPVVVSLAYRCTKCERIWPDIINDREKAIDHLCKGKKP